MSIEKLGGRGDAPLDEADGQEGAADPRLSVVITWLGHADRLSTELRRRINGHATADVDVVVVTSGSVSDALAAEHADVVFVSAPDDADVFQMRELGVLNAPGDIVVLADGLAETQTIDAMLLGPDANAAALELGPLDGFADGAPPALRLLTPEMPS